MEEIEKTQFREPNPMTQLLFVLMLSLFSGMLFSFLGAELIKAFFGIELFGEDVTQLQNPNFAYTRQINLILIACQHIGGFILPAFVFYQRMKNRGIDFFHLHYIAPKHLFAYACIAMVGAIPFVGFLSGINEAMTLPESIRELEQLMRQMEDSAAQVTEVVLGTSSVGGLLMNILLIAILPAIGEELLFRGIVQQLFAKRASNMHVAIWLSAALFSALHMQFYGFLPRFLLGGMLGYLFWYSGSIWVAVAAHFANNAVAILLTYFIFNGTLSEELAVYGSRPQDWLGVIVSVAIVGGSLFLIHKNRVVKLEE